MDAAHVLCLEPRADGEGRDLVRIDAATGEQDVLVPASQFIPEGASEPLSVENYAWSDDGRKLLLFTNSRRVWRINSRGDYWILDLDGRAPRQLGESERTAHPRQRSRRRCSFTGRSGRQV